MPTFDISRNLQAFEVSMQVLNYMKYFPENDNNIVQAEIHYLAHPVTHALRSLTIIARLGDQDSDQHTA